MITDITIRSINATIMILCAVESVILLGSFRKFMLKLEASRIFFLKMLITAVAMIFYAIAFIHHPHPNHDVLFILCLSVGYIGLYMIQYMYIKYILVNIREERTIGKFIEYFAFAVCVFASIFKVLSIHDERFDIFERPIVQLGEFYWIGHAGELILIAISLFLLIRYHKALGIKNMLILMSMPIFLFIATMVEPFVNGIELQYPSIMLEFLLVYTQHHLDLENAANKRETNNLRNRLELATGRMKPHYLYNVLTTIYYLCDTDPKKAQTAIGTFSEYLRNTLETMEKNELVSFSWELGEIRHYLALEKLRFDDRLRVEYDTEIDDFLLPPLTIQPLVENAVKHGIAANPEGGTVKVVSRRLSDGGAQVRVIDDGVGFDIEKLKDQDVTHEGIANVRERLKLECDGELSITSAPGKGATATVTLRPKDSDLR